MWTILAGLPIRDLDRLQSVISAAARLTTGMCRYDHVTTLLKDLHWLREPKRITYKLCVLVYNCLRGSAPRYLQEVIQPVAEVTLRRRLRSSSSFALLLPVTRPRSTTHWWPSVCRHHRLFVIAHFQTISQDLSIQSIICIALHYITVRKLPILPAGLYESNMSVCPSGCHTPVLYQKEES